jgi:peptidyl-prolyl cis-trans isomerase SurA
MFKIYVLLVAGVFSCGIAFGQGTTTKTGNTKSNPNQIQNSPKAEAEKDLILLTVGGDPVSKAEFEAIYHKNNTKETDQSRKALEEYMDLFVNFKLKVKAAKVAGKDTVKAFQNELKGYRRQLAQPYLTDKQVNEKLVEEAYNRMKKDIRASHILVSVAADALPKDTLAAYNKIISFRNRIIKGEDFESLATKVSEDPSAKQNGGDLGYFSSMMMVYPFENAAYNTPVGQISMPVRTRFGYHILKITDVRDAQGQVRAAHIMVKVPENANDTTVATLEKKIREIYNRVKAGEDFATLASQFSDDRTSGKNGGQLPWFGTGKMVPEFEKVAFSLKNENDISEPFRSAYGWHIVKLLEKKGMPSFDESKAELKQKISKDSRSEVSRDAVISRIKTESSFNEDVKALDQFVSKVDTSYLSGRWNSEVASTMKKPLFTLGNEQTTQYDFAVFLEQNQSKQPNSANVESLVRKAYDYFKDEKIIAYEDARLESKYPEFRLLMQEYRDGILLFEITDENVWSKALKDTAGLEVFYENNKTNYMWGERVNVMIYKCADAKTAKATRKLVEKKEKKGFTTDDILAKINKTSQLNLATDSGIFSKGDNELVDKINWKKGISDDMVNEDGTVVFIEVIDVIQPTPKTLLEARGLITADYQSYLEKEWVAKLKKMYKVEINQDVFNSIK